MARNRKMVLGAVARGIGCHVAAWRLPSSNRQKLHRANTLEHWTEIGNIAEAGKLHFIFIADSLAAGYSRNPRMMQRLLWDISLEPMTVLSALAGTTKNVGLVGTLSTTFTEPYNAARMFASLDHLSNGRAGWNVVTTLDGNSARNFGGEAFAPKEERYKRAAVFTKVLKGLWDSWEEDAFLWDKETGIVVDPSKMHPINHRSEHFVIEGPLNLERSPQGHPMLIVAGSSDGAKELAAEEADGMFTAQPEIEEAKQFYADVKGRMAKHGRSPDDLAILPGAMVITGRTDEEAQERHHEFRSHIDLEFGVLYLSSLAQADLSGFPLDEPLPDSLRETPTWSRLALMMDISQRDHMTFRELAMHYADAYGHQLVVGSPSTVADHFQHWFESYACDGFLLRAPVYPEGLQEIVTHLIPELQRRGLAQTEYAGSNLRENLWLGRRKHPVQTAKQPA
jgi:alkanesulfonate monooxygenase